MKTLPNLFLAAFLLTSFGVMEAGAAPYAQDGGLPALINEKEKGVFYLRVLNKQGQEISSGTGFLVDGKGTLVTALHVILPKRDVVGEVEAMDADGKTWKVEGVTASNSSVDLAVLKLEKVPDAARPLGLAGDSLPVRGAKVLVLGHPQGFKFVATDGIVSATHKTDQLPEQLRQSGFIHSAADVVWIQTSAAVSNGNSGGPLLNESGDVIGIVQWMARGQGMNFALQVASIRKLLAGPAQLQTLESFTEPEADFFTLMKDFQMDQMRAKQRDFAPFGFPGDEKKKPKAKGDPLVEKYVPARLALATKHRGKDVELQSLLMLMNISSGGDLPPEVAGDVKKAADRLLGNFQDNRRLLSFVRSPFTPVSPEAREFVFSLSKASSDPEIRALAALMSARCVDLNANGGDSLKTAMEFARAAAKCPPGIMYGRESVAEVAGKLIDMFEHGSVGCVAPELEGIDQDGKPVKLSDLKGRHVVVAFYTAENEARSGIAGELNDLVRYADGRPLSVIGVLVEFPNRFFTSSGQREVKKAWASIKDDADGALRKAWHISDAPTVFLIDPKSVIKSRYAEPAKETGMGFMNMFGGMNRRESDWKKDLNEALKGIPELETEADKVAKLPNRLKASPIDPSLLKGLELRYSFDKKEAGEIQDSSGTSHHAKATGGEWSDDPDAGGCYKLSKPGDKIESLDYKGVTGANPRTAAFWFKNVDTSVKQYVSLLEWGKPIIGERFGLWLDKQNGFHVIVEGGGRYPKPAGKELMDGKWHHVTFTLSGGGMLKDINAYVDGKPVNMSPHTPSKYSTSFFNSKPLNTGLVMPVTIGSDLVNGFMDEVMIWDRALDGVEIARLYKATGGQKLDPALESAILTSTELRTKLELTAKKKNETANGAITFVKVTNDADSGISNSNTYTHAIDFNGSGTAPTINGVVFTSATTGNTTGFTHTVANSGGGKSNLDGAGVVTTTGNLAKLMQGFLLNGNPKTDGTGLQTYTISGLTIGTAYDLRIYVHAYGSGHNRPNTLVFDMGGTNESTVAFNEDRATTVGMPDDNDSYYLNFRYTATSTSLVWTAANAIGSIGSFHLYGITNQVVPVEKVPAGAGGDAKAGKMKFSDWLKTVRIRNDPDDGSSLFVEGDFMMQTNTKGARMANLPSKIQRIDEERQTVYWEKNGRVASLSINPDRMGGLRITVGGIRIRVTVIEGKNATEKPETPKP